MPTNLLHELLLFCGSSFLLLGSFTALSLVGREERTNFWGFILKFVLFISLCFGFWLAFKGYLLVDYEIIEAAVP